MNDIELTERMLEIIDEADYNHWRYYNRLNRTAQEGRTRKGKG